MPNVSTTILEEELGTKDSARTSHLNAELSVGRDGRELESLLPRGVLRLVYG